MSASQKSPSAIASGHGIATLSGTTVLDVWFPSPSLGALQGQPDQSLTALVGSDEIRKVTREIVSIEPTGYNAVIRALPEAVNTDWNRLQQEVLSSAKAAFNK